MNPVAYLLVSLGLTSLMLSAIFFIAWLSFGRKPHALLWSAAFLVGTLQWATNLSQGLFATRSTYWLVVNALALTVNTLALVGHRLRAGLPVRLPGIAGAAAAVLGFIAWFTLVTPHVGASMAFVPLFSAIAVAWSARILLGCRPRPVLAEWGAATVMTVFAATQIAAGMAALLQGPTARAPFQDVYRQINFLALPAAYTGIGLFVVFILASDLSEEMKEIARHDPLTGLLNRRGFAEAAGRVLAQARRRAAALSLVLGDLDHFKDVNDTHGHACGDRALQHWASLLASRTRAQDVLARMGGEEFVLVLADTPPDQAARLAERLREDLEDSRLEDKGGFVGLTASFGVAALGPGEDDLDALLKRADAALYRAKREGRNRVASEPAA